MNKGKRRKTREEFISDSHKVHGDKYDYSKVKYINTHTKVCIICPKHGEFWQTPANHLKHRGCPECGKKTYADKLKSNTEEFIERAKQIHGDKYDYSKVDYKFAREKVCIICPEHGEFWKTPDNHLRGAGCQKCATEHGLNIIRHKELIKFIKKANEIYGDKYDYTKVDYKTKDKEVCIICHKHGEFYQKPSSFLAGKDCPKCKEEIYNKKLCEKTDCFINKCKKYSNEKYDYSKVKYINEKTPVCVIYPDKTEKWVIPSEFYYEIKLEHKISVTNYINDNVKKRQKLFINTIDDFIEKANTVHKNKYDYSQTEFTKLRKKLKIICPKHGEFFQSGYSHIRGIGCPYCGHEKTTNVSKKTLADFISDSRKLHGDRYDYSKVDYVNNNTDVCIICPEHGEFWQLPRTHLKGSGCPICRQSKLETKIRLFLLEKDINFETEKTFEWLKHQGNLRLDFYLPDYNIAIECQGEQHYKPVDLFGCGEDWALERFKEQQIRDTIKQQLCEEHGILVLYYRKNDNLDIFKKYFEN